MHLKSYSTQYQNGDTTTGCLTSVRINRVKTVCNNMDESFIVLYSRLSVCRYRDAEFIFNTPVISLAGGGGGKD